MSATDKTKLDGIASGAQVNSITGVKGNAESSYRTGNVNLTPANIAFIGMNPTGGTSNDTREWWTNKGTCYAFIAGANQVNGQPADYGFLISIVMGTEVHQEWWTQPNGAHYHRGGNNSTSVMPGWTADDTNIITSVNGQIGAVSITPANIGAVAKSGDTMTGNLTLKNPAAASNTQIKVETVRSSGSVTLRADNEGGNIAILSPNGKQFEMDVHNDTTFRLYAYDNNNNFKSLTFSRTDGQLSASGSIVGGGSIIAGNASATYQAHATAQTVKGQYFIYCDGSSGARGLWTINSAGTGAAVISTNDSNTSTFNGNATNVTGTVAIANGGTGATTAANARSSLGITPANIGAKATQSAVSSPTASGTAAAVIDTISQNAQGVITATKKSVTPASIGAAMHLSLTSSASTKDLIFNELKKIQNGEVATIYMHSTPFSKLTGKTGVTTFGTVLRVTTNNFRFNLMDIAGDTSYGFQATVSDTASITHGTIFTYKGTA
jgi:hypothetical protein